MKHLKKRVSTVLAMVGMTLLASSFLVMAQEEPEPFLAGGHYELLDEVQPVQTGDKIEVVELFWYRCPHCFALEPFIVEWKETIPDNAQYVPIPALLNKNWEFGAKAYYTFEALGLVEQLHGKFFDAIHLDRRNLETVEALANWAEENGADRQAIIDTFDSFAVVNKLNFSSVMSRKYGITGVPSIIVDGRYRTTISMAGSQAKLIEVINFLIDKVEKEKTG